MPKELLFKNDLEWETPNANVAHMEYEGMNFPQVLDAQAHMKSDKVWLVHGDESLTYREFSDITDHLAVALQRKGLKKGDPCGLLYPNSIRYLLLQFAILKAGAVLVPLNTRYRGRELLFMLNFTEAGFLFMVSGFLKSNFTAILKEIKPGLPALTHIYVDGPKAPEGMVPVEELFNYRATPEEIENLKKQAVSDAEPASILFTSGTTSQPKAVLGSHRGRIWTGIRCVERLRITEKDVLLNPLPFCHEFGGFTIPSHAILHGCKMVIMDVFNEEEAMGLIQEHRISVLYGVPAMFTRILNSPDFDRYDLSSLRTGYMSGATCPLELVKAVQEKMGCNLSIAYGLSEVPSHTISDYDDPLEIKATTIGKPVREAEARIVDDRRQEVSRGTAGEIALRGKNMMIGYYKNPDLTARVVDKEGFLYTGDLGMMDANGYLHFLGRKTDMIVAGGFNIYPLEIEEVLYELPQVALAATVGVPDGGKEEMVIACIVLREEMTATTEEILEHCKRRLANYKVPKRVVFMKTLPMTLATSKIKKNDLIKILKETI